MKGDFTRDTFKKSKHYRRVLMQQGRVQVDADWNEQLSIDIHIDRTARRDIIGHHGGPQGNGPDGKPLAGFEIIPQGSNLRITAGRYYVDGILVENEAERLFTQQDDYRNAQLPTAPGNYLVYLDVWEAHLTALEDAAIREVALNGPDTATRTRVLGQVKWQAISANGTCQDFGPAWIPTGADSTGRLAARAQPDPPGSKPCIVPEEAGYRRLENQLYRVEIHNQGQLGTATFKWSRENGSIVTRWKAQDGDKLIVSSVGRDEVLGFANQQWIELTDEIHEQAGTPGTLVMIDNVDGDTITIDPTTAIGPTTLASFDVNTAKIRRWESKGAESVTVPATNDGWIPLEDGVQIKFKNGNFRTGDYWLIPARTLTHAIEWNVQAGTGPEGFQLRHGIQHFYCPLAIGSFSGQNWGSLTPCRRLFPPLTEIQQGASCCTVSVGDGVTSVGDFTDIQAAIDSLGDFGRVCILAGVYQLKQPVEIGDRMVIIEGCGPQTAILAAGELPAFVIKHSQVEIASLAIRAGASDGAVIVIQADGFTLRACQVINLNKQHQDVIEIEKTHDMMRPMENRRKVKIGQANPFSQAAGPAIFIAASQQVTIEENLLHGLPAVLAQMQIGKIERNQIVGGGVWIADGSADINIESNTISRGRGAGIILGSAPRKMNLSDEDTGVDSVQIFDNTITGMQGSGITSVADQEQDLDLGELEDIHIRQNRIRHCALAEPDPIFDPIAAGGIVLRSVAGLYISDNLITNNGSEEAPACGIFTFFCLGLQIANNTITENGSTLEKPEAESTRFYQAGIAALYVVGGELSNLNVAGGATFQSTGPAAVIHNNIVICPRGQALIAGVLGPISISENTLTSQGPRRQPRVNPQDVLSPLAVLGQSVIVINLGRTPGLGTAAVGNLARMTLHTETKVPTTALITEGLYPDGRTLFHGNQVTLEILENAPPFVLSCVTLVAFDDVSFQDNQVLTQIIGGLVLADVIALGITVRAHGNRIHELPLRAIFSYVSLGFLNNATGNQLTHCLLLRGTQVARSDNQVAITTICEKMAALMEKAVPAAVKPSVGAGNYILMRADIIGK